MRLWVAPASSLRLLARFRQAHETYYKQGGRL
jgi:hypothetical protein